MVPMVPNALYTPAERARRDRTGWDARAGHSRAAPVRDLRGSACASSSARSRPGQGHGLAAASVVVKTLALYAIMVTGCLWEKAVFGRYLFAPAFYWEDVFSMLVLALHTAYPVRARLRLARRPRADAAGAGRLRRVRDQRDAVRAEAARRSPRRRPGRRRRDQRDGVHVVTTVASEALATAPASPVTRIPPIVVGDVGRLRRRAGAARTRTARGVLRTHRHHLAASQDAGRVLPGGRLAHLRAPDPVRRRRDDLRRAALRDRDHRRARPRRPRRRARGTRSRGRTPAGAAPRHPHAVPRRLVPVGSHQVSTCRVPPSGCPRAFLRPSAC